MAAEPTTVKVDPVTGQTLLTIACEVCGHYVSYQSLAYHLRKDKYACPRCYALWYT